MTHFGWAEDRIKTKCSCLGFWDFQFHPDLRSLLLSLCPLNRWTARCRQLTPSRAPECQQTRPRRHWCCQSRSCRGKDLARPACGRRRAAEGRRPPSAGCPEPERECGWRVGWPTSAASPGPLQHFLELLPLLPVFLSFPELHFWFWRCRLRTANDPCCYLFGVPVQRVRSRSVEQFGSFFPGNRQNNIIIRNVCNKHCLSFHYTYRKNFIETIKMSTKKQFHNYSFH